MNKKCASYMQSFASMNLFYSVTLNLQNTNAMKLCCEAFILLSRVLHSDTFFNLRIKQLY
ncbi:hypothetical protein T05_12092 [Trichinella murrelli]|uniref:Uncharacterized protein n=1 Tax=Trichinella murrelli TaxID=144512 RepID=A0A0V0TD37_9BILA|nr:hypothetical protein T05_12092 [Trichinella murrelli]